MALTDSNDPSPQPFQASARNPLPVIALERLPLLQAENFDNARLAGFLAGAVHAAGALTLLGMAALTFAAGESLKSCFGWALLLLIGIAALLRSYIRSTAAAFDRSPMLVAAQDLRAILLYTGFAWGAGAFLVLGPVAGPATLLAFAALPGLALTLILKDRDAPLAFTAPVTFLCIMAAMLRDWPDAGVDVAGLLMLQSSIAARQILRGRDARASLPAGLSLR